MIRNWFNQWFHVSEPQLKNDQLKSERLETMLKQALPIVEREALGTRPTKETWELLEAIKKAVG